MCMIIVWYIMYSCVHKKKSKENVIFTLGMCVCIIDEDFSFISSAQCLLTKKKVFIFLNLLIMLFELFLPVHLRDWD